ncbi:hypothetical protein [Embleya hyalina]|uniref:hypothetical protein n=1 Tax=Embleya hyalina TaxID=516124 RepID=UPI000F83DEE3|nr:hypothetical protein [Embleya hyalina]
MASTAYDASDEIVDRVEQYLPGFRAHDTTPAAFRNLRPIRFRAVVPYLHDSHEDVREAAGLAALVLAEHPTLARHHDHFAVHARHILDAGSNGPNRRTGRKALETWGHDVADIEPLQEEPSNCGPHSDGRGDLEPPFSLTRGSQATLPVLG